MKLLTVILASALLIPFPFLDYIMVGEKNPSDDAETMADFFIPEDITLVDDALKGETFHPETWYIEAFFNHGYSMVFIITLWPGLFREFSLVGLYLYQDGHLIHETRVYAISPHFDYSREQPQLIFQGEETMVGYLDETGGIRYTVVFEKEGTGINLTFRNETKGWQGKMGRGWWLAIPELDARGSLLVEGETIPVEGRGYHDHNIFDSRSPLLERGYSDGKFHGDSFSLVWGKIFHSQWDNDTLGILSTNGTYISIPQERLSISEKSYILDHGHRIPIEISISITGDNDLQGSLIMITEDFHYIHLPFLWYWRYHTRVQGIVQIQGMEHLVETQGMMELMLY